MNDKERRRNVVTNAIAYAWVKELEPERIQDGVIVVTADEARASRAAAERAEAHLATYGLGFPMEPPECDTPRLVRAITEAVAAAEEIERHNTRDAIRGPTITERGMARAKIRAVKSIAEPLKLALEGTNPMPRTLHEHGVARARWRVGVHAVLEEAESIARQEDRILRSNAPDRVKRVSQVRRNMAHDMQRMLLRVLDGEDPT